MYFLNPNKFAILVSGSLFIFSVGCGRSLNEILGKDSDNEKLTVITTPVDGVWLSKSFRVNSQNDVCRTRLIIDEGKALLGQTCGKPEHLYHLIAFGPVETNGTELKINVDQACQPVTGIDYPTEGNFKVDNGTTLTIEAGSKLFPFTSEVKGQLGLTDSATVGCFGETLVIPSFDWNEISEFAKRALAPYKSAN